MYDHLFLLAEPEPSLKAEVERLRGAIELNLERMDWACDNVFSENAVRWLQKSLQDLRLSLVSGSTAADDNAEKGRKALEVLGRLHDMVSGIVEGGSLEHLEDSNPALYGSLVNLLVNESLPLFAKGERGKVAAVPVAPVAPVAPSGDAVRLLRGARLAVQWCADAPAHHAPRFGCSCAVCTLKSEIVEFLDGAGSSVPVDAE